MQKFKSVENLVNQLKPNKPVYCIRKNSILSASNFFQKKFPGKILFAVKTNPHPEIIKTLIKSGVDRFDVASMLGAPRPVMRMTIDGVQDRWGGLDGYVDFLGLSTEVRSSARTNLRFDLS